MHLIENMTDPDDRHSQARQHRQPFFPQGIDQPNFGLNLAAEIPEVHIPEHITAPRQFPMPAIPPLNPLNRRRRGNVAPVLVGALAALNPAHPGVAPVNDDNPFVAGIQTRPVIGWRERWLLTCLQFCTVRVSQKR